MTDRSLHSAAFRTDSGVVYIEFLLSFLPLFTLMLALVQLGLLSTASIIVRHAAHRCARAAIVVLPDDHNADYDGDPVNQIASGEGLAAYRSAPDNGRLAQIRTVARIILSPLAPSVEAINGSTLSAAVSGGTMSAFAGLSLWSDRAIAVTFPDADGGYRTRFGPEEPVSVAVTCLFPCSVPIVSTIMCDTWWQIDPEAAERLASNGAGGAAITVASGGRVLALQAVATLPNQGVGQ